MLAFYLCLNRFAFNDSLACSAPDADGGSSRYSSACSRDASGGRIHGIALAVTLLLLLAAGRVDNRNHLRPCKAHTQAQ